MCASKVLPKLPVITFVPSFGACLAPLHKWPPASQEGIHLQCLPLGIHPTGAFPSPPEHEGTAMLSLLIDMALRTFQKNGDFLR